MKSEDIKKLSKCMTAIRIKECNDLSAGKEYFDLYDICNRYRPKEKWGYSRINELSPFSLKAIEELTGSIKEKIAAGVITEDCYDDITMLAIIFSHLSQDAKEEYHYSEFDWLLTQTDILIDKDKIRVLETVFNLLKKNMNDEKYLTLSNALWLIII